MYLVCLDYFAAACCTRKACCSCGSSTKHAAKATKLVYFFIILFAAILSTCFRFISLENSENFLTDKLLFNECEDGGTRCLRTQAILRISWSACLFFIFMIFMVAVKPKTHLGAWVPKLLLWICLLLVSFLGFPSEFFKGYTWASRIGSAIFLLIQVLMLVDFAYDFHDYCLEKIDQRDIELDEQDIEPGCLSNMWKVLYVTVSGSLFIGAIIAHAFMISRFGGKGCFESTFFTVESLVAGIILTLVSLSPPIGAGLLPPSVVFINMSAYTWGAVSNNPDSDCNPGVGPESTGRIVVGLAFAIASIAWGSFRAAGSAYNVVKKKTREQNTFTSMEDESIAYQKNHQNESLSSEPGTTSYAEIASNSSKEDHSDEEEGGRGDLPAEKAPQEPQPGTSSAKNQGKVEEEEEEVEDPYACSYHFIMMCAGLYLGMLFTNWRNQDSLNEDASNPELSHTSMWVRMAVIWIVQVLFFWSLVAPKVGPMICSNRDFE